ncbi:MAG: homocysteine S-methyltransferase family protein [Planctomycetota bacterium]
MTSHTSSPVAAGFLATLAEGPLLLSGGFGSELERRGVALPAPLWSTAALDSRPDRVRDLHRRYVRAGARVVVANTFRTARHTLAKVGRGQEARPLTALAIRLAREGVAAADPQAPVFVAGSIAPLEDCYRPDRTPDATTLRVEHAVHVGSLVAAGATLGWIETMPTLREAVTALEAARAGALPAVVSFVLGADGRLLDGEDLAVAAREVAAVDPLAILVNCCPVGVATRALDVLGAATGHPFGAYANGRGSPARDGGWGWQGGTSDRAYVAQAQGWPACGARLVGGCCGTSPRTIRKLARRLMTTGATPPSRSDRR